MNDDLFTFWDEVKKNMAESKQRDSCQTLANTYRRHTPLCL